MIGGIFETIGKTLGVGKEKYFLELDDAAEDSVKNIKQAATKVAETAKEAAADVVEKAPELIDETAEQADKAAAKVEATAKKAGKKAKSVVADKKPATKGEGQVPTKKVAPAVAPTSSAEEDLIVAAIAATARGKAVDAQGNVVTAEVTTFATDYLPTPSRSSRRRPGPSLSPFKGMAKEVNPRLKG